MQHWHKKHKCKFSHPRGYYLFKINNKDNRTPSMDIPSVFTVDRYPLNIYLFNVNNRNTIKGMKDVQSQWRSTIFLSLNIFHTFFCVSVVDFEQVNVSWVLITEMWRPFLVKVAGKKTSNYTISGLICRVHRSLWRIRLEGYFLPRDNSFNMFAKFSQKQTFLMPWSSHTRVRIKG